MFNRRFLRMALIGLLIISFVLEGCSQTGNTSETEGTAPSTALEVKEQIPFRITWTDYSGRGVAIQKIVDTYNAQNDSAYEIVLQSGNEDIQEIEAILDSDAEAPILVLPYRFVKYLGEQDNMVKLTESFKDDAALFYPELWKLGMVDGEVYGIPWLGHSICLIYNKGLLAEAGVDPESIDSLDTFVQALKTVELKTRAKGVGLVGANHNDISWMVNRFVYGFGSKLVDETGKKVVVNNDQAKAALAFYKNTLGTYAQPTWLTDTGVEVMDHFRNQEIAFEFQGVWGVADIAKNGNPFEVGVINLEDIGLYSEVGPMMLSIPASMAKDKQEEAMHFISYLISTSAQESIMNGEYSPEHDAYYPFRVPVRMDLSESQFFKNYPEYLPFIKGFKKPSVDVPVPKWQIIKDKYYASGLSQYMRSEITLEDFLLMIETEGNTILNSN